MINTSLDIDGVLANFTKSFLRAAERKGLKGEFFEHWTEWNRYVGWENDAFNEVWDEIQDEYSFWLYMEPYEDAIVDFPVRSYITARDIPRQWIEVWLFEVNDFPPAPVIQVGDERDEGSKVEAVNDTNTEVYVDDNPDHVRDIMRNAPNCAAFLYIRPHNMDDSDGLPCVYSMKDVIRVSHEQDRYKSRPTMGLVNG